MKLVVFTQFRITVEDSAQAAQARALIGRNADFVRLYFAFHIAFNKQVGGLTGPARCCATGIGNGGIADVIREILADIQIIGVIHP